MMEDQAKTFQDATLLHAMNGLRIGLEPVEVINTLMMVAIRISIEKEGLQETLEGLARAAAFTAEHG